MTCHFSRFGPGLCGKLGAVWHRCTAPVVELAKWQRRCDRLVQLQGRIRYPSLKSFIVGEKTYDLPLRTIDSQRQPSQEELEYLAGFFDGDGCVTMTRQTGQIAMIISQNVDSAEVLWYFRDRLGGSIGMQMRGTGRHKACLLWRVTGARMRHAAALLSQVPSMKQAQLRIAARTIAKTDRAETVEQLRQLKQKDHCPKKLRCTWRYFAGFFDAEGSVSVMTAGNQLRLSIDQVNSFVLKQLMQFLHRKGLQAWRLYVGDKCSKLVCVHTADSTKTLGCLLGNGLLVKKKQAEIGLTISNDNFRQVREAIMGLNGWQNRYARLDTKGMQRAKAIQALQTRANRYANRRSCAVELNILQAEIQGLQQEHMFLKLVSKCRSLRKDIRNSLSEGAFVT